MKDIRDLDYRLECAYQPGIGHIEKTSWDSIVYSDGWAGGVKQYVDPDIKGRKRKQGADFRRAGMWERQQINFRKAMDEFPASTVDYFSDSRFILGGAEVLTLISPSHPIDLRLSLFTLRAKLPEDSQFLVRAHLDRVWNFWSFLNRFHPYKVNPANVKRGAQE